MSQASRDPTRPSAEATETDGGPGHRVAILILGMHRSGTSALSRVVSLLGATLPEHLLGARPGNPTGHWEPERLVQLHDRMLAEAGSRWDDWRSFDAEVLGGERLADYKAQIRRLIVEEYGDSPLLVLKEPRICRFVPLYEAILDDLGIQPRFLLIDRNPLAVIESLDRRDGMTEGFAGLLWLRHSLDAEWTTRDRPRAFTSYEALLDDWRGVITRITRTLEVEWPRGIDQAAAEIETHLSEDLHHHPRTFADLAAHRGISSWIKESYAALQTLERRDGEDVEALATLDRVRKAFEAAAPTFGAATFPELAMRERRAADDRRQAAEILKERKKQLVEQESTLAARESDLAALESALAAADAETAKLHKERDILRRDVVGLRDYLNYVTQSKSWRLTAPLRAALLRLRAVKRVFLRRSDSDTEEPPRSTHQLPGVDPDSAQAAALHVTGVHIAHARVAIQRTDVGRFSVVMPTWNRRETVGRAIESVLAQSYEDWELILCDDGSTDGTEEYVRKRFASDLSSGRIRYLQLEHRGVSAARNAGLAAARGRWIAYLDSDNAWHPHYLLLTAAGYASDRRRRTAYACVHVHDTTHERDFIRSQPFDWGRLLSRNYIDLNVFSHHRDLYEQLDGFDESLTRLVDWDLILRYTLLYEPRFLPFVLCDYHVSHELENITLHQPLETNEAAVRRKFATAGARGGTEALRLAYVLWDWPALSQTFVLEELRGLISQGIDVRVYYAARPDRAARSVPDVVARRVADAEELARLLLEDRRNWIHSHFAYPAVTELAWPAAEKAGIAFSFMPHAVDIFHHANRERNRIGEIAVSPLCARVMVYGDHHRRFLIEHGVPADKIIMTPQAVDTDSIRVEDVSVRRRAPDELLRVLTIARFIEKKGIEHLIEAAALLDRGRVEIRVYGYGPLEDRYRTLIAQHGLETSVRLCGTFEGADALREAMTWADVFCLPCVEAENGDVDGMPTVFFEAMAAGVPCVAGAVSAIPDFITDGITGFLVPPRDAAALAATLRRVAELPPEGLVAVARAARGWTDEHLGSRHTIDALLDSSAHPPLDIFMVTYHRNGHGEWSATERAIRSVLERTTTPFVLTLVDNGSEETFLERLRALVRGDRRIRLVELGENLKCGPASNIALQMAQSELVVYVCSNEGYAARPGWERPCLRYMRNRPHVAMGGRLVSSPSWPDGRGYMRQEWFTDFRNPEFAQRNPDREFFHVQGGLWVLRRDVFEADGGFSERRPQAQTDVEYSYFLESRGHTLGDIPGLLVLSNKTRPGLGAFLDETVVAVHPVFDDTLDLVHASANGGVCRCNICGWIGQSRRDADGVSFDCPQCASSPRDRAIFRWLAASNLHHRGMTLDARGLGESAREELRGMFDLVDSDAEVLPPDPLPGSPSRMLGIPPWPAPSS